MALSAVGVAASLTLLIAGTSSDRRRRFFGRLSISKELLSIQLKALVTRHPGDTLSDMWAANLDVWRFLKLVYLFRTDVLDTCGDYLSRPPAHLRAMIASMAEASKAGVMSERSSLIIKDLV